MRNNLAGFMLAACLLMPPLAGWLIRRPSSRTNGANSPGQAAPSQAHIGEPTVQESFFYPSPPKLQTEPRKPQPETMQANGDATFTNLESPNNSQDLNQNQDWARKFPIAALDWAQNATNDPRRDTIAKIAFSKLADTNPAWAVTLARKISANGADLAVALLNAT